MYSEIRALPSRRGSCYIAAMFEAVSKRLVWLWVVVPIVAIAELVSQAAIPLMEPSDEEWREAAAFAASVKGTDDLLLFAPAHATQAVLYLKGSLSKSDFGHFDASSHRQVIELSVGGAQAPETQGFPLEEEKTFGRVAVRRYRNPAPAKVLYNFVDHAREARDDKGRAPRPELTVDPGYRPRFAIPLHPERRPQSITYRNVPVGGEIYGYAFIRIVDFRREIYDRDGPLELEVFVDGRSVGRKKIQKTDPMVPFRFDTQGRDSAEVRFEVRRMGDFTNYGFAFVADVRE